MFGYKLRAILGTAAAATLLGACGDDATTPGMEASVRGRVEQTSPAPSTSSPASSPQRSIAAAAETVSVVRVEGDGSLSELASADVAADGSFTVDGIPAGRGDLEVVAYAGADAVGSVLIQETSRAGETIVAAPINAETTLEARAYSELRASGSANVEESSELELLIRMNGASAETAASTSSEIEATAAAYDAASATLSALYAAEGTSFGASARAHAAATAAIEFAASRDAGMSAAVANDAFIDGALDAFLDAGVDLEETAVATAAAATTFDAALNGESQFRDDLVVQPLRMNLRARERLAAGATESAEGSVALAIQQVLTSARLELSTGLSLLDLQALLNQQVASVVDAGASACVQLLAGGASSSVQADVRTKAEAAFEAATLATRLEGVITASAAVDASAGYKASVRSAVQAMIDAAGTDADVDVLTTLFIAAAGGASIS